MPESFLDGHAHGSGCRERGRNETAHAHEIAGHVQAEAQKQHDDQRAEENGLARQDGVRLPSPGRHAFGMSKKSAGMYRGFATADGQFYVAIYTNDPDKRIELAATLSTAAKP